jgi:hypothetical protein
LRLNVNADGLVVSCVRYVDGIDRLGRSVVG